MLSSPTVSIERRDMVPARMRSMAWSRTLALAGVATLIAALIIAALSVRGGYITDLPPPSGRETYAEVMPARVAGLDAQISAWPPDSTVLRGARARYGTQAKLEIVHAGSVAALDAYVEQQVRPRLADYARRIDGRVDGRWQLHGRGEGRLFAWQNDTWLFLIQAQSDEVFDEVVERFAYIRHR